MKRLLTAALLATAVLFIATTTSSAQPFPGAVLVNGGWVPCSHPIAINAGLGCVQPFEIGRYYANGYYSPTSPYGQHPLACSFKIVAIGKTFLHQRQMLIAETIHKGGCPVEALFFDPDRARDPWYTDITDAIPPEYR